MDNTVNQGPARFVPQDLSQVEARLSPQEREAMKKVSKQFEGIFLNQVVGAMRKTVTRSGFIPESQAEKIYQSMLDSEHAQGLAESGEIGMSRLIYEQLLRTAGGR